MALLAWPRPLFPHQVRAGNLVLHVRSPLPRRALEIAEVVRERVARSPFYSAADAYDVFLCDSSALFTLLVPHNRRAGGSAEYWSGNVFLRPSRVERDRLIGPSGREAEGERTLTYFVAHEVTHLMVARRLGIWRTFRLTTWQREGYADYVAKAEAFDYDAVRRDFRANAVALDPLRSGLYLRYHLLVAHLLDRKGLTPDALLAGPLDAAPVEQELRLP